MRPAVAVTSLLAALLAAACAEPAPPPPRTAPRAEPRRAERPSPAPLELSDQLWSWVSRMNLEEEDFQGIGLLIRNPRAPWKDLAKGLDRMAKLHREQGTALSQRYGKGSAGPPLVRRFLPYHQELGRQLGTRRKLLKAVHDGGSTGAAIKGYQAAREKMKETLMVPYQALATALCKHVRSHGVREGEARFAPCLHDGGLWVKKFETFEKEACACQHAACAEEQQRVLNRYIRETKGVKVAKADANRVAKAVLKGQTCVSRKLLEEKLKGLRRPRP